MTTRRVLSESEQRVQTDTRNLVAVWRQRNDRINAWYLLRRLVDRWKEPGKTSFVSNSPKVYFNLARHLLSGNPPRVRVLLGEADREDRTKAGVTERAVLSVLRSFDDDQWHLGKLPWRTELADQICMGWVNVFYAVLHDEQDARTPVFRADIWDNMTVYPEWDDQGLVTVVHEYLTSAAAAQAKAARFGKTLTIDTGHSLGRTKYSGIHVSDWWRRDENDDIYHSLLINGQEIIPIERVPEFNEIPVLVMPVGGESRRIAQDIIDDPTRYICASVLEPIERTTNDFNDWMTMMKQIARDNAQPNYIDYTEDGQGFLDIATIRRGGGVHHAIGGTDKAEILPPPTMMAEVGHVLTMLDHERQTGSVSNTVFAEASAGTSGYLYSQLQAAALTNLAPYQAAQDYVLRTLAQEFVEDFRDGNFDPITIKGRTKGEGHEGGYFLETWRPRDIPDDLALDVRTELALQRNRTAEIAAMRQANSGTPNLLDEFTLLDEIGNFDDPMLIQNRRDEDSVRTSPAFVAANTAAQMQALAAYYEQQGDAARAKVFTQAAKQVLASIGGQGGGAPTPPGGGPPPPQTVGVQGRNGLSEDMMRSLLQRPAPQALSRRR